jgi:hypothetical protein
MKFDTIEITTIALGAKMRVSASGCTIAEMIDAIKSEDPDAKFEDKFFVKGGRGGYEKDVKLARAESITVTKSSSGTFIDFVAEVDDTDISIRVPKDKTADFPKCIFDLGALSEKSLKKLQAVFDKGAGACSFNSDDEIGIKYYPFEKDGNTTYYLDSVVKEAPQS